MFKVFRNKAGEVVEAFRFDGTENSVIGQHFYYEEVSPRLSLRQGEVRFIVAPGGWVYIKNGATFAMSDAEFKKEFCHPECKGSTIP